MIRRFGLSDGGRKGRGKGERNLSKILELLQRIETPKRKLFELPPPPAASAPDLEADIDEEEIDPTIDTRLVPIASGKGGVGKTNVAVNLSIALADRLEKVNPNGRVILVDCDFGLPNADILLGTRDTRTIDDFVKKRITRLSEAAVPTAVRRLFFLSGSATPSRTLSNLHYQQRQKFLRHLRSLRADFIVLDLGASVHFEVVDFFAMVNTGIIVTNPEPTALRDSFLFLRTVILRKIQQEMKQSPAVADLLNRLDRGELEVPSIPGLLRELQRAGRFFEHKTLRAVLESVQPKIIVNRADHFDEGLEVIRRFRSETKKELGIEVSYLGPVLQDDNVVRAVKEGTPFLRRFPECDASHWIRNIAERISENRDFEIEKNYFSFGSYLKRLFGGS
ncbi:MAG: MinD/ParA family protein [Candidatus Hydrogenedentota bacterium]|nr:MAG: MinD/ParA family protein [Candidatus Hydrogenedentota bacterium]